MSPEFDVTVIMPCYNAQQYIAQAIESVLNQKEVSVQLICIDDGSVDETLPIIERYGENVELKRALHGGANAARNLGLDFAKGEYVKFLDSDDLLCQDALKTQVTAARNAVSSSGCAISVYGKAGVIDERGQSMGTYPVVARTEDQENLLFVLEHSPITSCPLHLLKSVLDVGGFTVGYPTQHEHDLHFRLALSGVEFRFHDNDVYLYRQHMLSHRITADPFCKGSPDFWHSYYKVRHEDLLRFFDPNPIPVEYRRALSRLWWRSGRWCARHGQAAIATKCFHSAMEMGTGFSIEGRWLYRTLVRAFGPVMAERFLLQIRS